MSVLLQLAAAKGEKQQDANIQLAQQLVARQDKAAIKELVAQLKGTPKAVMHDCIKVLYEVGTLQPALIQEYAASFITLLHNSDNRMQWGAMTAISAITSLQPEAVYKQLEQIMNVAKAGSVITLDNAVRILVQLASHSAYRAKVILYLQEVLHQAPVNQLPMYAEQMPGLLTTKEIPVVKKILEDRLVEIEKESKKKRVSKVISKLK